MVKERMDLLELVNCLLVRPPTSTSGFRVYCVRRMKVLQFVRLPKFVRTRSRLHTLRLSALPSFRSLLGCPLTN